MQNFYILFAFLLIAIGFLIAVSIYCYIIKYQAKQKKLLMSNKVKDIDTKNRTCYFLDDIINTKTFDPNNIKLDEKSYKNFLIYYIGYVTIKDLKYMKINIC